MDYILSNDWLLFPMIGYVALCVLKWQYVVRKIPLMLRHLRTLNPNWPRPLFWLLHVWIPVFLLPCSAIFVPVVIFREGAGFWRVYPDSEMIGLAEDITGDHAN